MSKTIIIAAASALFFTAAPALAQDASGATPGFNGPHGSATNLRDTPPSDPTAGHVKVFDGSTGAELRRPCNQTGGDAGAKYPKPE
jgi:hypothetical protein